MALHPDFAFLLRRAWVVLVLSVLWGDAVCAQAYLNLRFEQLTQEDGLSQGTIQDILQDRQGFLWFATHDGLNRYDGYEFKVYNSVPFDKNSLRGGIILDLDEGHDGHLWLAMDLGGVSRLDPRTDTFTHFEHDPDDPHSLSAGRVVAVHEDRAGALWAATYGDLSRMDPGRPGHFTRYLHDPTDSNSLSAGRILSIGEGEDGVLWVVTQFGISRMDPAAPGRFERYPYEADTPESLKGNDSILIPFGQYAPPGEPLVRWIGSSYGLVRFDATTGRVRRFIPNPNGRPGTNVVRSVAPDPRAPGILWVPVADTGVARFDTATETFTHYFAAGPDAPPGLLDNPGLSIYAARSGSVWLGSSANGLNKFTPSALDVVRYGLDTVPALRNPNVWGLAVTSDGALWAGTNEYYVHRIDPETGTVRVWEASPDAPSGPLRPSGEPNAFAESPDGTLWLGTTHGLDHYDPATDRFEHFRHDPDDPTSLSDNNVLMLLYDRHGALWVGTGYGLNRLDAPTNTFTRYLDGAWVTYLLEDHAGFIWAGTEEGISRLDPETGAVTHFFHDPDDPATLTSGAIGWLHERGRELGVLWIASLDGGGLDRLDTRTGRFTHYTVRTSTLPSNALLAILEDNAGLLWLSTTRGLARFDPEAPDPRRAFQTFTPKDGLLNIEYSQHAAHRSADGRLYFGGTRGIDTFQPDDVERNTVPPSVVLTGLLLNDKRIEPGSDAPLKRAIAETREITVDYGDRNMTFEFVGLHFKDPANNRYRYFLDGFDGDWIAAGTRRTASYTNLPPGAYTFRVTAANADGAWNEEDASVQLRVLPPWWRTVWAYLAYGVLFAAAVAAVDRVQRRRIIARERERTRELETRLRIEAAEATANYLQAENERQTHELEQARALQLSMLPAHMPEHPLIEVAARMQTATEVGGDYYDFHVAEDGTLTVAIGDATGHGAQAGTMVTAAKSLFTTYADEPDPAAVLRDASRALRQMRLPKLYMAFALAKLRGRTLEVAGAGMPPALVWRAESGCVETVPLKGLPLGAPAAYPYRSARVDLVPGDTVLLMSDGFPELMSEGGDMFGYEAVLGVFAEAASGSAEVVVQHFEQTAATWLGGRAPNDDMTFVVLKLREER